MSASGPILRSPPRACSGAMGAGVPDLRAGAGELRVPPVVCLARPVSVMR